MDYGLLLIRAVLGLALVAHGAQKMFGLFGGVGLSRTGGFFESIGFRPGVALAVVAALGELGGGWMLALGLLTPLGAALVIATMLVAVAVHADKGFFAQDGGFELPLLLAVVAAGLAFTGAGRFSVDHALQFGVSGVRWGLTAVVLGVLGAVPPLMLRAVQRRRAAA